MLASGGERVCVTVERTRRSVEGPQSAGIRHGFGFDLPRLQLFLALLLRSPAHISIASGFTLSDSSPPRGSPRLKKK